MSETKNEAGAKRFWVSWYEPMPDGDWRPFTIPDAAVIPGYWKSGETMGDPPEATVCAVVCAADEDAVKAVVSRHWRPAEYRFVEERPMDWQPGSRFPLPKGA